MGVDGVKISKSRGNAVDPLALTARFGVDALRWWFVREVARDVDVDFTEARPVARADRELAHGLGNLVHRTVALVHRLGGRVSGQPGGTLAAAAAALPDRVDAALARFDVRAAAAALWAVVEEGNRTVTRERPRERPWELRGGDRRLHEVLATVVQACRTLRPRSARFCPMPPHDCASDSATAQTSVAAARSFPASPQTQAGSALGRRWVGALSD